MPVGSTRMSTLRRIALVILAVWATATHAVGLGWRQIQSSLGQPLRAAVQMLGTDHDALSASCFKAKIVSSDGHFIAAAHVSLKRERIQILQSELDRLKCRSRSGLLIDDHNGTRQGFPVSDRFSMSTLANPLKLNNRVPAKSTIRPCISLSPT
jgi:hypothetical protein